MKKISTTLVGLFSIIQFSTAQTFTSTNGTPNITNASVNLFYDSAGDSGALFSWHAGYDWKPFNFYSKTFSFFSYQTRLGLHQDIDANVGVGIATPAEKLEVSGNIKTARIRSGSALFYTNSRNSLNSFNTGLDPSLNTGWISLDLGGNDNSSDRIVMGTGVGGKAIIGTHNYNLTAWGGDLLISPYAGNVGIGTANPDAAYKLSVNGKIRSKEIKVEAGWSDYVFNDDYKLKAISEVENFIKKNHHLPDVPSAAEVEKNGVNLGETSSLLLKKIEELTLYLIEKDKQVNKLSDELQAQRKEINQLKLQVNK